MQVTSLGAQSGSPVRVFEAKISYQLVSPGQNVRLTNPGAVKDYLRSAYDANPVQEQFFVVLLNRKGCPLGRHLVSLGTLTGTLVSPREVFRAAILANAASIVVSHNHPSGDPTPSVADFTVTRSLREAAKVIDIELLDHVIVGTKEGDPRGIGHYSLKEAGFI